MHFSVGALIERDGKYLLIERAVPPLGFAGVAGHVDEGEDERHAIMREVKEEIGFDVHDPKLLLEEELDWNWCVRERPRTTGIFSIALFSAISHAVCGKQNRRDGIRRKRSKD